jgi:hypothetical protein
MNELLKKTLLTAFVAMGFVLAFHIGQMWEARESKITTIVKETPTWYTPWESRYKVTYADGSSAYIKE